MAADMKSFDQMERDTAAREEGGPGSGGKSSTAVDWIVRILTPLASLKLTVALFALSIFIVFAGTLAQTEKDIWQVIREYFRMDLTSVRSAAGSAFSWIDFRIFFPRSFFPEMTPIPWGWGFWFPSGWLIGFGLLLNLTAAHLIRFRICARGNRLIAGLITLVVGVGLTAVVIAAGSEQTAERLKLFTDWPSLRILWLLMQCTLAGVVLLGGCLLVFGKRAGIVLLHAGIALMMIGELVVGIAAEEGEMQIVESQTVNYVMDTRHLELAIIDPSGPTEDHVAAIPDSRLRPGVTLRDPALPFDAEVLAFHINSVRREPTPTDNNLATAGTGLREIAEPIPPVSGTDTSGESNRPALYVRFLEQGTNEPLGVFLIALDRWLRGQAEPVTLGGTTYEVFLRYKHNYRPYSMHLVQVRHDRYMGTQTARSYSSELRLVDPGHNVDRMVRIWMNNPLRYGGETFYQSTYGRDPASGREYTGLQVVTNTGWRIPYVSCMLVVVGMLAQLWSTLGRFLHCRESRRLAERGQWPGADGSNPGPALREKDAACADLPPSSFRDRSAAEWIAPLVLVVVSAAWIGSRAYQRPAGEGSLDLAAFGRLPVMYEGRVKPFDTLARNSLRVISDRQIYRDQRGVKQPAVRWLLDVITDSEEARKHRVFRIQNLDVLKTLGLPQRKGFRYSIEEFAPQLEAYEEQVRIARSTPSDQRDLFARKILELDQRLNLYLLLRESFGAPALRLDSLREDLSREANRRERFGNATLPLAVPPTNAEHDWQAYAFAAFDARAQEIAAAQGLQVDAPNPATLALREIFTQYAQQSTDAEAFNRAVAAYRTLLTSNPPVQWSEAKTDFETFFNYSAPTYHAMILYAVASLIGCFSWLGWSVPLRRAATWLTCFTLILHSLALLARMYISGRPPITNLYSSAIFVGWACVILGLLLERYSKIGVANVIAAFSGFATLMIAFLMTTAVPSFKGDSFTVLVAVLDTQFWLATHVTTITAGYSATFVAGLLGIVYVVRGLFTRSLSEPLGQAIARMIYGTVCFAMFFSFLGTVLGGLWADDSWGRFWGWDPKENGALIIVLWNAIILHAIRGQMVGDRGLAVLAIFGNVVTAWSWFGVNELQVGLHTYGFTEGVLLVVGVIVAVHLAIIGLGMLPRSLWRSATA